MTLDQSGQPDKLLKQKKRDWNLFLLIGQKLRRSAGLLVCSATPSVIGILLTVVVSTLKL